MNRSIIIVISFLFFNTQASLAQKSKSYYPAFSWKTVPIAFHFGKSEGLLTADEAKFVTSKSNFICLEKGHAIKQFGSTEKGIAAEVAQLKKINPNIKVIFYWNAFLDYPFYDASKEYDNHPEWWLKTKIGELDIKNGTKIKRYDLSNPQFRTWYSSVAKAAVTKGKSDGIFMDAFPQVSAKSNINLWGKPKYDSIQVGLKKLISEVRTSIGPNKLIVYNGIRSRIGDNIGNNYPENTDAVMIEHFDFEKSRDKESMLNDILEMRKAAKSGKIVAFKAWPSFSWLDEDMMKLPLKNKKEIASKNITFPLAAFLVGAQENCYFIYNWGYRLDMGCLEWYPELDMKLGKPLQDMQINGFKLSREYEHVSVVVDLEKREAKIVNKK
ncbi:hypothetical protein PBAC_04230 [Pedobacter glucosidilyticus]|nr:putative glycoside hydrolase [Pedobacter glucosidilyticus]KHJ39437.1 hypothetical protein PBAC_04230 [Pedobacter glucosidilyticus]